MTLSHDDSTINIVLVIIIIIIIIGPLVLNSQGYKILKSKQVRPQRRVYSVVKVLWKETALPR